MKVLLYGGGSREHAIAWKISQSSMLTKLYLCKPNDGFSHLGEVLEFNNYAELAEQARLKGVELLIVGPEAPLIEGIVKEFNKTGIPAIGPDKKWAMLEGSKSFAKDFMERNKIPTAAYSIVENKEEINNILKRFTLPVVLKADGLAAGKGVAIINDYDQAKMTLEDYLDGKFGEASKKVLVEEFLAGEELSLISLWDGKTLLPFISARDYKRLQNNDKGPNTGGMGSYCPVEITEEQNDDLNIYIDNLQQALTNEKAEFTGVIYSGLMLTNSGIKVLEYNMRFGDPETQPLLMHLDSDLLEIFNYAAKKQLDKVKLNWKKGCSLCVVVAAKGYPLKPKKGGEIKNIQAIQDKYDVNIFFAGVKKENDCLLANGGRVLSVCKTDVYPDNAVYSAVEELVFEDKVYRTDIKRKKTGVAL